MRAQTKRTVGLAARIRSGLAPATPKESEIAIKGNKNYGAAIAAAALADPDPPPRPGSWLDSWTEPAQHRSRKRRWLSMWLKSDLKGIPPDVLIQYLSEMSNDVIRFGTDAAVDRLIDKILPRFLSNGGPQF